MLDAEKLAKRIREAMDSHEPPVTGAELSAACSVTPQAVSGWRRNGRIHKRHLESLAEITDRPIEFFLSGSSYKQVANGEKANNGRTEKDLSMLVKAWEDGSQDQRSVLTALARKFIEDNARKRKRGGGPA